MNIYQSITQIMKEVPAIGKEQTNKQQGFKFRGIDDVMNALQPLLAKNKVFIVPEILEQTREERTTKTGSNLIYSICKIKYKFYAEDGSFIEAITIGEGMDSGDKATNKAMAIAMKYALFQVFCIPTEEMKDPDGETPEPTKPKQNNQKQTLKADVADEVIDANHISAFKLWVQNHKVASDIIFDVLDNYGYEKIEEVQNKDYQKIVMELDKLIKEEK